MGFSSFFILGLSGGTRGGLQLHQRKTNIRYELPFSTMTPIYLFYSLLFPSFHWFPAWDQGISID
jgi:hypothetical protein